MKMQQSEVYRIADYLQIRLDETLIDNYHRALSIIHQHARPESDLAPMLKHTSYISLADAGFAILNPHHELRMRILLLSTLMETSREHVNEFIISENVRLPWLHMIWRVFWATLKAPLGIVLIKWKGWK